MPHTRMIITIICVLLSTAGFAKDEDIYKWVDAKKQVHYGSNPPIGVDATLITPAGAPSDKAISETQAINEAIEKATTTKPAGAEAEPDPAQIAAKKEACDKAKSEYQKFAAETQRNDSSEQPDDAEKIKSMLEGKQAAADEACAP